MIDAEIDAQLHLAPRFEPRQSGPRVCAPDHCKTGNLLYEIKGPIIQMSLKQCVGQTKLGSPVCNVCCKGLPSGRPEGRGEVGGVRRETPWRLDGQGVG